MSGVARPEADTSESGRPRPLDVVELQTDDTGRYVDGNGQRTYVEDKAIVALHHVAVANGWEHTHERTPYENLRALLEATTEFDRDRGTVETFAFANICGYGPDSTPRALDRLAAEGVEL